jgi:hypothetical protein
LAALRRHNGMRAERPLTPRSFTPMKNLLIYDAQHWRVRAEEARTQAELMIGAAARRTMLELAESYEKLARRADERTKRKE